MTSNFHFDGDLPSKFEPPISSQDFAVSFL